MALDPDQARQTFESSSDFTVGLEEEFALLDSESLSLVNAFERLVEAARQDEVLGTSVAGELISSEIEIRSGRGVDFADAVARQAECRSRLFALAAREGLALGATGTHPWSPWQEQRIIDTPHYRRVEEGLKYVAWRNNTFSVHTHVGIQGPDRAVAVCDAMRPLLPTLLAVSANSAFLESCFTGLHSVRTQVFTKSFPRCGVPDFFGGWQAYEDYLSLLVKTGSITEHTQLWWSVRPHSEFGTVEIRIMDAQSRAQESSAMAALATACVAQAAIDYDEGLRTEAVPARLIEENMWRAIRYGLDGSMIDLVAEKEVESRVAVERLLDWAAPARAELKLDPHLEPLAALLEGGNGAQRQWRRHEAGETMRQIFAGCVEEARATYAGVAEAVTTAQPCGACGVLR
jgi:glutamate---cysteine ligase / carboxylate-amine ligase